jgi:hypothetical protein
VDEALFVGECRLARFAKVDLSTQRVPFEPDEFDVVLLLDVLEHLDGPRQYALLDDLRARSFSSCRGGPMCPPSSSQPGSKEGPPLADARGKHMGGPLQEKKPPLFVITAPNVAFFLTRFQLLFGKFNYGKRGILDQTHRKLFTFRSLKRLLVQCGYRVQRVRGIPAPYPAAIGLNWRSKTLLAINRALIAVLPKLFSYQVFMTAVPLPTAEQLLAEAEAHAGTRGGAR